MTTKKLTTEQFITKAKSIQGDRYVYSLVEYKTIHVKVKIICKKHGVFEQAPSNHIAGQGCKMCANEILSLLALNKKVFTTKLEFSNKASIIHNNKYNYSLVEYVHSKTKVKIICPTHGEFAQLPYSHLQGHGCKACALVLQGWTCTNFKEKCENNTNGFGILYILECWSDDNKETFIKIGITSNSIKKRYSAKASMPYNFKVLHEITDSPEYIYNLETVLHKKSLNYKYTPITHFGGSKTECFLNNKDCIANLNNHLFNLVPLQ